jgi:hypothetical protein
MTFFVTFEMQPSNIALSVQIQQGKIGFFYGFIQPDEHG